MAAFIAQRRKQRTLRRPVEFSGIGLHTGAHVYMRFCPASEDSGIYFSRIDQKDNSIIPAHINSVFDTSRSTNISNGHHRIYTVEHVLSALSAYQITNACIELSNIEPPIATGGSDVFVQMIEEAEIVEQEKEDVVYGLTDPIVYVEKNMHLVALPSTKFEISYTLDYPQAKQLGTQFYSCEVTADGFKNEIAQCRTFALANELMHLFSKGLIQGGSFENAVVVQEDAVISKGGLHFPNEMARHKVLDLIGDLSLVQQRFFAHIIALRSGHTANVALAKKILEYLLKEKGE